MEELPKKKQASDIARDVGRAIVSLVPAAGGPLQIAFESVFSSPLEKRKEAWLEQLAGVMTELQARVDGLTPERLAANEIFVTVAMQASQIAIRNHQQVKLDALRNAVLNSVLINHPDEDEQMIFVRLIDHLTPWHLRLLQFLDEPRQWMERNGIQTPGWSMGGVGSALEHSMPRLRGQQETYDQIIRELQSEGLISQGQFLHVTMTADGMLGSRSTERGKRFIRFITDI